MTLSVRSLQEGALQALAVVLDSFDDRVEAEIQRRSDEPEYVDATEILIVFGKLTMDEIP